MTDDRPALVAFYETLAAELQESFEAERRAAAAVPVEVIPAGSVEATRIAALLRPESFAAVPHPDPFGLDALDLGALDFQPPEWP